MHRCVLILRYFSLYLVAWRICSLSSSGEGHFTMIHGICESQTPWYNPSLSSSLFPSKLPPLPQKARCTLVQQAYVREDRNYCFDGGSSACIIMAAVRSFVHACISHVVFQSSFFRIRFPAQSDLRVFLVRIIANQSLSLPPLLLQVTCTSAFWLNLSLETSPSAVKATKALKRFQIRCKFTNFAR